MSGLFGLKVSPGEVVPLDIFSDVRITNIAFGEEIKGNARSVVKVHRARFADPLDDLSEEDEFSSEDEGEDENENEDEEEEEAVEDEVPAQVNGKKDTSLKVDDEEEDSDSEEDMYSEDSDDVEVIEEDFVICSLYPEKTEQAIVDLEFSAEEEIAFSVTGENAVELVGYYIQSDPYDDDPDSDELYSDEEDDDEFDDEYDSDELAMFHAIENGEGSDEEMDEGEARIQEILEKAAAKAAKNDKKRAKEEDSDEEVEATKESVEQLSKNQKKKLNKKLKTEVEQEKPKPKESAKPVKEDKTKVEAPKKDVTSSKKTKTASGLLIEDKEVGKGPQAKAGNRIGMRYVGRLTNGKQFDSNTKGKPFSFKLGKGEVIAGWDEGIKGMQEGGTRRLTIPPQLAYGKKGAPPDIPANSTLVFDVKLVEIK